MNTLLSTIPPYWKAGFEQMSRRMGDPRTAEGQALLAAASPVNHAEKIKRPLLIGQGANDPRVKQAESDQIINAMKKHSLPVTYVLFPDEGHGFARPENSLAFNAVQEQFLAKCLGGRAEALGDAFTGSSITIPEGVALIDGAEALLSK
ncbi:prolyl oligopeptidase family serine peptidase [bacterium]|nr:prolyl oligopeptidase family serine peptidase [bacterium]